MKKDGLNLLAWWLVFYGHGFDYFRYYCVDMQQLKATSFTLDSDIRSHFQSDESFRATVVNRNCCINVHGSYLPPEGVKLTAAKEAAYELALVAESRSGFQRAFQNLIILFINFLLFVVHRRIASRARSHTDH